MGKRGGFPGGMGGFGGMNINQLMKEAKKMQADMEKSQEELTSRDFEATAGGGAVYVKVSGAKVVKEIKVYYTKSQSIIDRLHNKIQIDDKHYSINPFGKHVFLVQEKENYDRYMSSNKESMSVKHKNGFFVEKDFQRCVKRLC